MQRHSSTRLRAGHVDIVAGDMSGRGSRVTSDLLFDMACNFAKRNLRYHTATGGDLVLAYSERSIQSVLFSSIEDAGAIVFSELPIRRKYRGQKESFGWVDLWADSRGVTHIIETKTWGVSLRTGVLNQATKHLWRQAVSQSTAITSESLKDNGFQPKDTCRLALLTLRVYQSSARLDRFEIVSQDEILALGQELADSLSPAPSWCAAWTLSPHLQKPIAWFDDRYISYPGVFFFACVNEPMPQK